MMRFPQYEVYKTRFHIALVIFFTVFTFNFGYVSHEMSETARNYGQLLTINVALVIAMAFWLKIKIRLKFKYSNILYVLIAWLFFIMFFRADMSGSSKNFFNILFTQILVVVVANILWRIPFDKLLNIFLIYLHACLLLSLYVHVSNGARIELGNHDEEVRFAGLFFFGITGILAGVGAIISSFQYFRAETKKLRTRYMFSAAVFGFYTLATDMRTVMGGIVAAVFVQYLFKRKSENRSVLPLIILAGFMYIGLQVYQSYSQNSDVERDFGIREVIWGVGQKMISDQPLTGYGSYANDLSRVSLADTRYSDLFIDLKLPDPHSSYLSIMIQSGIVTFVIILFLLAKIVQLSKRYKPINRALLSIIAFWLVCATTGGNYFDFTYNITGMTFELTMFGIMLHPELWDRPEEIIEKPKRESLQNAFAGPAL
jgi:O-antigen ligase